MKERLLTNQEVSLAKMLFKDSVDYIKVKIHDHKYLPFQPNNSGMTPNGEIYVADIYKLDYSKENSIFSGFFIHEMTHVWQYQNRVINVKWSAITEFLEHWFQYENAYPYKLQLTKDLIEYDLEQQASIIEDYYRVYYAKLQPRHMQNHVTQSQRDKLFKAVLGKFLKDPKYARNR